MSASAPQVQKNNGPGPSGNELVQTSQNFPSPVTTDNNQSFQMSGSSDAEDIQMSPNEKGNDTSNLSIGPPDSPHEQEADHVADHVVNDTGPVNPVQPAISGIQAKCGKCAEEEKVQKKGEADAPQQNASSLLAHNLSLSRGKGASMDQYVSEEMEQKMGADFSPVKVHTDANAVQMNRELGAKAFTHGQDIYFNQGQYAPDTAAGKHLLAHELTHTVQQGGADIQKEGGDGDNDTSDPPVSSNPPVSIDEEMTSDGGYGENMSSENGEIRFDDQELFSEQTDSVNLFDHSEEIPLWTEPIPVPPPVYLITADLVALLGASLDANYYFGPCSLKNILLTYDTENDRYTGSAMLDIPGSVGLELSAFGGLDGSVSWLGLLEVFGLTGLLDFTAEGGVEIGLNTWVDLTYENDQFSFSLSQGVEGNAFLNGSIDFVAMADLFNIEVWSNSWNLNTWEWNRSHEIENLFNIEYSEGEWRVFSSDLMYDGFDLWELAEEAYNANWNYEAMTGSDYPLSDALNHVAMSPDSSIDPVEVILAIRDAPEDERLEALADPLSLEVLQFAVGSENIDGLSSILNGEPSEEAPMLDAATALIVNQYLEAGNYQMALQFLVEQLAEDGFIDMARANFTYDKGPGDLYGQATHDWEIGEEDSLEPTLPVNVEIYELAMANLSLLLTTVMHEYKHVQQARSIPSDEIDQAFGDNRRNEEELQAYYWDITHSRETGLFNHPALMEESWDMFRDYYSRLSDPLQQEYAFIYGECRDIVTESLTIAAIEKGEEPDLDNVNRNIPTLPEEPRLDTEEDLNADSCYSGELTRDQCEIPYTARELRIIMQFGDRRNINVDPNLKQNPGGGGDQNGIHLDGTRPDDAPLALRFRISYNMLDRWRLFINQNEPGLYNHFETEFIDGGHYLTELMKEVKTRTSEYKEAFRNLDDHDPGALADDFEQFMKDKKRQVDHRNERAARWYQRHLASTGMTLSIPEIKNRVNRGGFLIWRDRWLQTSLEVNRILGRKWRPAKRLIKDWVTRTIRGGDPDTIGDINYIGSLARGYKGPPKQKIQFYTRKFDVDANLTAPVLADYGIAEKGANVDRGSINSKDLQIPEMEQFKKEVHGQMSDSVFGYDEDEEFEIFIDAQHTSNHESNERLQTAKTEVYELREYLDEDTYQTMIEELENADLVIRTSETDDEGVASEYVNVKDEVREQAEFDRFMEIIDRYRDL